MTGPAHSVLFDAEPAPRAAVTGVPAGRFGTAAADAALAGDGYGWLAGLLPEPQPLTCGHCGHLMVLPAAAAVLWVCPSCHPEETS